MAKNSRKHKIVREHFYGYVENIISLDADGKHKDVEWHKCCQADEVNHKCLECGADMEWDDKIGRYVYLPKGGVDMPFRKKGRTT